MLSFINKKPKIVSVYAKDTYFGIGDYMRGIIHLLQNENYENVYINYDENEISKYLFNDCGNNVIYNNSKVHITNEKNYSKVKNDLSNNNIIYLYHNASITYPIDKHIKDKIKKMFIPKFEFSLYIENLLRKSKLNNNFITLHIRLFDDVFTKDRIYYNNNLENYIIKLLKSNKDILIISNSLKTKNYLISKYNLKGLDTLPSHTGKIGTNKSDIKSTLAEFFIISESDEIHQHCEDVLQESGFSKRISEIYNIPFFKVKN